MAAENPVVFAEIGNPKRVTQLTENTSTTNAYFLTEKAGEPEAKKTAYATVENAVKAKLQSEYLKVLSPTPSDTKTMSEKLEVAEFKKRDDKIVQLEQDSSLLAKEYDFISPVSKFIGKAGVDTVKGIITGSYINVAGGISTSVNLSMTDYIEVHKETEYVYTGKITDNACIALYNAKKEVISVIKGASSASGGTLRADIKTTSDTKYIACSCWNTHLSTLSLSLLKDYANIAPKTTVDDLEKLTSENKEMINEATSDCKLLFYNNGDVICDKNTSLINAYVHKDTGLEISSTTYKCTDFINVGTGVYGISVKCAASAAVCFYDKYKKFIYSAQSFVDGIALVQDKRVRYIRLSTYEVNTLFFGAKSKVVIKDYTAENTYNNVFHQKGNMLVVDDLNLQNGTFRIFSKFKLNRDCNNSPSSVTLLSIRNGSNSLELNLNCERDTLYTKVIGGGDTQNLPHPKRNSGFSIKKINGGIDRMDARCLPTWNELVGDGLFYVVYRGEIDTLGIENPAVQDDLRKKINYKLHINDTDVAITDNDVDVYRCKKSSTATVNDLIADMTQKLSSIGFLINKVGDCSVPVSSICNITDVRFISNYIKGSVSSTDVILDAFPVVIELREDSAEHEIEVVCIDGTCAIAVDGQTTLKLYDIKDLLYDGVEVVVGDGVNMPYSPTININHTSDAEIDYQNKHVISVNNPVVNVLMGHAMFYGDECDGLEPAPISSDDPTKGRVVPPEYENLPNLSISSSSSRILRIGKLAKEKGYTHMSGQEIARFYNGGFMPKRCYCIFFDDLLLDNLFVDKKIKSIFDRISMSPNLSLSFRDKDIADDVFNMNVKRAKNCGYKFAMHGYNEMAVGVMTSDYILDMTNIQSKNSMAWQLYSAENLGIDTSSWIYSNGFTHVGAINVFKYITGVKIAPSTWQSYPRVVKAMNRLFIRRNNISDKTLFSELELKVFV